MSSTFQIRVVVQKWQAGQSGHAQARPYIARILRIQPESLRFKFGRNGKPRLALPRSDIQFNISHSGKLLAIAVSRRGPVGCDIEKLKSRPNFLKIAERFFHKREIAKLKSMKTNRERLEKFYQLWTAKEACIKALSWGVPQDLHRVEILSATRARAKGISKILRIKKISKLPKNYFGSVAFL